MKKIKLYVGIIGTILSCHGFASSVDVTDYLNLAEQKKTRTACDMETITLCRRFITK